MKAQTKIIGGIPNGTKEIDWGKRQWMISRQGNIVLSTGEHVGDKFYAVSVKSNKFDTGDYDLYAKEIFTPITTPITIEISNTHD